MNISKMKLTQYKLIFCFVLFVVAFLLLEGCTKINNHKHQSDLELKDIADSNNEYFISDSKIKEIENTLANYLHHSGMNENERRKFIYDLCDTIHPCLYSIFFRYTSIIDGFVVEGKFGIPSDGSTDFQSYGTVFGELFFSSDSHTFQIFHGAYKPFIESFPDTLKPLDCIELEYKKPVFPNRNKIPLDSIRDLPFAFIDINFDGKKELLLAYPGLGQKSINTYTAYTIPELKEFNPFKGYAWNCLDEWTEFDYSTKTVISSLWAGYDGSEKWYFKYDGDRLKPYLKEEYTHWFDSLKTSTPIISHTK